MHSTLRVSCKRNATLQINKNRMNKCRQDRQMYRMLIAMFLSKLKCLRLDYSRSKRAGLKLLEIKRFQMLLV